MVSMVVFFELIEVLSLIGVAFFDLNPIWLGFLDPVGVLFLPEIFGTLLV
jgi:hypothetical protein